MPTYTYRCDRGHEDEQIRKIADRDILKICKICRKPMDRQIDAPGMVWAPTSTGGRMKV